MKACLILLPALAPALMIAGCHRAPAVSADNASVNAVAAKVAAAGGGPSRLAPGQYATTYTVTRIDMPGLPASARGMMDAQMKKVVASTICITPEQAARPAASMFAGQGGKDCTYDHFAMSPGAMDATMTCRMQGTVATSTMKGSFAADGFHMDVTTDSKGANPMASMTMAATIDAKRTGACAKAG